MRKLKQAKNGNISNEKGKDIKVSNFEKEMFFLRLENENLKIQIEVLKNSLNSLKNNIEQIRNIIKF